MEVARTLVVLLSCLICALCEYYDHRNDHLLHIVKLPSNIYQNKHNSVASVFTRHHHDVSHSRDLSYADHGLNHDLGYSPQKNQHEIVYIGGHGRRYRRSRERPQYKGHRGNRKAPRYDHDQEWDDGRHERKRSQGNRFFGDSKRNQKHDDKWSYNHGIDPWEKVNRNRGHHEEKRISHHSHRVKPSGGYETNKFKHREEHHSTETKWVKNNGHNKWGTKSYGKKDNDKWDHYGKKDNVKWDRYSKKDNDKWDHYGKKDNDKWDHYGKKDNDKWDHYGKKDNDKWDQYGKKDDKWDKDDSYGDTSKWASDGYGKDDSDDKWGSSKSYGKDSNNDKWDSNDDEYEVKWDTPKKYNTHDSWVTSSVKYSPPKPTSLPVYKPSYSSGTSRVSSWVVSKTPYSNPQVKQVSVVRNYGNQPTSYSQPILSSRPVYSQPQVLLVSKPKFVVPYQGQPKPEHDYRV